MSSRVSETQPTVLISEKDFTYLLWRHYDALHRFIAPKTPVRWRAVFSADDILQETYETAWKSLSGLQKKTPESIFAWLKQTAYRKLLDRIEFHKRQKRGGGFQRMTQAAAGESSAEDLLQQLSGGARTPSSCAAYSEAEKILQDALLQLKPHHRRVIELRYLEQLDWAEIAQKMQSDKQALHMLLRRAMDNLRTVMGSSSQYFSH